MKRERGENIFPFFSVSCYTFPMSVTQTVEIPANHRLIIDVPREVPAGQTVLTFTPTPFRRSTRDEWINPLLGLAKTKGAKLTLERFIEMQQEEIECENENDRRLRTDK